MGKLGVLARLTQDNPRWHWLHPLLLGAQESEESLTLILHGHCGGLLPQQLRAEGGGSKREQARERRTHKGFSTTAKVS